MNTTTASSLLFRRSDFRGWTNKYSARHNHASPKSALTDAIDGVFPYDPTDQLFLNSRRDEIQHRLSRYALGHRFYDGDHHENEYHEGEKKTVFNYTGTIVDKASDWLLGKGWRVQCKQGNEQVAELLNAIWDHNRRDSLTQESVQFSATTGDSFYYVTVRTKDRYGRKLPKKKWTVRIQVLDPAHVHPLWSETTEGREMAACMIQFPTNVEGQASLYTTYITPDKIYTWLNETLTDTIDNPIGEVNVVAIPNFELAGSDFGKSDIETVIPVNQEYNVVANSIRKIIQYHAEPTTVIFGAKVADLQKGVNKVWSGLPVDGRVENLQLQSDLGASYQYLEKLEKLISELSSTPRVAFDSFDVRVSSSSAAALELMFQPLIEKTARRRVPHNAGVAEVNRLALIFQEKIIGDDISILADDPNDVYSSNVEYTSPLPRDEAVDLDLGIKRVNAGVWSQAELIRKLSGVKNYERLVIELMADRNRLLFETYEKQRALLGERPSSLVSFLGSETLSEDINDLQEQLAVLERLKKPTIKPPKPPVAPKLLM